MHKAIRIPLLALALVVVFAGTALATGAINFTPTLLARGTLNERVHVHSSAGEFEAKGPLDFVTQTITFGAPGTSGWHSHPGMVLVTVASGTLVRYEADCSSKAYGPGSAFLESGNHAGLVRNESTTTPAVVYVTFVVPKGTTALRIDKPNPGCPQN